MTTVTCGRCGHSFETQARTNTRCRRCRTVVHVGRSGHRGMTASSGASVQRLSAGDCPGEDPATAASTAMILLATLFGWIGYEVWQWWRGHQNPPRI